MQTLKNFASSIANNSINLETCVNSSRFSRTATVFPAAYIDLIRAFSASWHLLSPWLPLFLPHAAAAAIISHKIFPLRIEADVDNDNVAAVAVAAYSVAHTFHLTLLACQRQR